MTDQEIKDNYARCLMPTYRPQEVVFTRGKGAVLFDREGREYLDFVAGVGVNVLGHGHPRLVTAVQRVAGFLHLSNHFYVAAQAELACRLASLTGGMKSFFCNSGAEAVEGGLKLARKYARERGRPATGFVSLTRSFHGRTFGALSATGQERYGRDFQPLVPGFTHVAAGDGAALEAAVGPGTAAVLLEPVQGEGGVYPLSPDYLRLARRLCDRHGALLILDEIQCGLGRTGRLFAFQHAGVEPDVLLLAKALGGGVPIGAVLARREVADAFRPGDHGSTFGGNPLATGAALAVLEVMEEEDLPGRAAALGERLRQGLEILAAKYAVVREVRGIGLMLGMELDRPCAPLVRSCLSRGLVVNCTEERVLRFLPPLVVEEAQVDRALSILEQALAEEGSA